MENTDRKVKLNPAITRLRSDSIRVKRDRRATVIQGILSKQNVQDGSDLAQSPEEQQLNCFKKWTNYILKKEEVKDLANDFQDGVVLIKVLQKIIGKPIENYNEECRVPAHRVENAITALHYMENAGITLSGSLMSSAEDLYTGSSSFIRKLLWALIEGLTIKSLTHKLSGDGTKAKLVLWIKKTLSADIYQTVAVEQKSFSQWIENGMLLCALLHSVRPEAIEFERLHAEDKMANLEYAFDVAEKKFNVPRLLNAKTITSSKLIDERCMMVYLSYVYGAVEKLQSKASAEESETKKGKPVPEGQSSVSSQKEIEELKAQHQKDQQTITKLRKELHDTQTRLDELMKEQRAEFAHAQTDLEDKKEEKEETKEEEKVMKDEEKEEQIVPEEEVPEMAEEINLDEVSMSVSGAKIVGDPMEGVSLTFEATYNGCTPENCIYVWTQQQDGDILRVMDCEENQYTPCSEDVGFYINCECTPVEIMGQEWKEGKEVSASTEKAVDYCAPRIDSIKIIGGRYHLTPLMIMREYYGGVEGESIIKWSRSIRGIGEGAFRVIPDATTKTYQPTADDLDCIIKVEYTPVREDGLVGECVSALMTTLTTEPKSREAMKKVIKAKSGAFYINRINDVKNDFMIEITGKKVILKRSGENGSIFSEKYNSDMDLELCHGPEQTTEFNLTISRKKETLHCYCRNSPERDVLAVCFRWLWAHRK